MKIGMNTPAICVYCAFAEVDSDLLMCTDPSMRCTNPDSSYVGDIVHPMDWCNEWEEDDELL